MKTVSGTTVSMKAVSISKAARILSKFAFSDNGASPAFAAYLKRASASFDELVQLDKAIKGFGSERKDRKKKHHSFSGVLNEETMNSVKRSSEDNGFFNEEKQLSSGLKKCVDGGGKGRIKMRSDDVPVDNAMSSLGVESDIVDCKDKKKKMDKVKEKNIDSASNRTASEIAELDGAKDTKVKKKRDKGKKEKSEGDLKVGVEGQNCPPSKDAANQEATKVQEHDGSEQKQKKKKRMEHEKEERASVVDSKQKDQTGGNGYADGYVSTKNEVDGESSERKRQEKKRDEEGAERKGDNKDGTQEANDNISRKRKHKGDDSHERLDNSEERHRSKKKKK